MSTTEVDCDKILRWDETELRPSRLIERWSQKPEYFKSRVLRPRPSRRLKYAGVLLMSAAAVWVVSIPIVADSRWPSVMESTNRNFTWQFAGGMMVWFAVYAVTTIIGAKLFDHGRKRRR